LNVHSGDGDLPRASLEPMFEDKPSRAVAAVLRSAPLLLRTCLAVPGALPSILISLLQTVLALHLALALYLPAGMCMVAVFSVVFAGWVPAGAPFVFRYIPSDTVTRVVQGLGCPLSLVVAPVVLALHYLSQFLAWAQMRAVLFAVPIALCQLRPLMSAPHLRSQLFFAARRLALQSRTKDSNAGDCPHTMSGEGRRLRRRSAWAWIVTAWRFVRGVVGSMFSCGVSLIKSLASTLCFYAIVYCGLTWAIGSLSLDWPLPGIERRVHVWCVDTVPASWQLVFQASKLGDALLAVCTALGVVIVHSARRAKMEGTRALEPLLDIMPTGVIGNGSMRSDEKARRMLSKGAADCGVTYENVLNRHQKTIWVFGFMIAVCGWIPVVNILSAVPCSIAAGLLSADIAAEDTWMSDASSPGNLK